MTCPGEIPGIVSGDGSVCCDAACGRCGGSACQKLPGGANNCCIGGRNGVLANSDNCGTAGAAPCVLGDGEVLVGTDVVAASNLIHPI